MSIVNYLVPTHTMYSAPSRRDINTKPWQAYSKLLLNHMIKIIMHRTTICNIYVINRSLSLISKDAFTVPNAVEARCKGSFDKKTVMRVMHSFLIEFGYKYKPFINSGTLKTSAYNWFIGYFIIVRLLTTDTIQWLVRTSTVIRVPAFLGNLLNLCLESHYATKTDGLFRGFIPVSSSDELLSIFKAFTVTDIKEICEGTFLSGWAHSSDIKVIHKALDSIIANETSVEGIDTNNSGIDYTRLFEHFNGMFTNVKEVNLDMISVSYTSYKTTNLAIYKYRNNIEKGRYVVQSKGLDSLSDSTFSINAIFLRLINAQFVSSNDKGELVSQASILLPGELTLLIGSIPINDIFNSLFSIRAEEISPVSEIGGDNFRISVPSGNGIKAIRKKASNNGILKSTYTTLAVGGSRNTVKAPCKVLRFYFDNPLVFTLNEHGEFVSSG